MSVPCSANFSKSISAIAMAEAAHVARVIYGCREAVLRDLGSERDQNFRLQDGNDISLLKISHPDEDPKVTNIQTEVLTFLQVALPDIPVPAVLPGLNGQAENAFVFADGISRICRRFSFMAGVPVSSTRTTSAQRRNLGASLARLDMALAGFTHPAAAHELLWDLSRAHDLQPSASIMPAGMRQAVEKAFVYFTAHLLPMLPRLRCQVIHGDFHPGNVFCDPAATENITGVIDFGDCLEAPLIHDLAILCAYHVGQVPLVLEPVGDILVGYYRLLPLTAEEISILHGLVSTRLAMRLVINRRLALEHPEMTADFIDGEATTFQALQRMQAIEPAAATAFFMQCIKQEQI